MPREHRLDRTIGFIEEQIVYPLSSSGDDDQELRVAVLPANSQGRIVEPIKFSVTEKQLLVEILEAAYRRQKKESADVIAFGDSRFHNEVTERLCIIGDLLDKVGSSAEIAVKSDPVEEFMRRRWFRNDAE